MGNYDIAALPLPAPLQEGLERMITRQLGFFDLGLAASANVRGALFGAPPPSFGQVQRITPSDITKAAERAGLSPTPVAVRELAGLFSRFSPETPVCNSCGEVPLSNIGGVIFALEDGSHCPFCETGIVHAVTMRLQMLAWTTGRLVPPQMEHDFHVVPGERIPLQDFEILLWIGDPVVDRTLERMAQEYGVPLYGVLAFAMLDRHILPRFQGGVEAVRQAARDLLVNPRNFGFSGTSGVRALVRGACMTLASREPYNVSPAEILRRRGEQVVTADDLVFALEGRLGFGDSSDVFSGARIGPFRESVVVKVLRALDDEDLMTREARVLARLAESDVKGAYFFTKLLPQVVARGLVVDADGVARPALVLRNRNGYDWTLADVMKEYPEGVEPKTAVWMWNRLLTFIAWLQNNHIAHSAIVPAHVLINPVAHGAVLLDYAYATPFGEVPTAVVASGEPYYPKEIFEGEPVAAATDVEMSARCIIAVLGGNPATGEMPSTVPEEIASVLYNHASYDSSRPLFKYAALELADHFGHVAESVYGPRKYHLFKMPRR